MNPFDTNLPRQNLGDTKRLTPKSVQPFVNKPTESIVPWVIEFRIPDSPKPLQIQVKETMIVGRGNGAGAPHVDLTPHQAYELGVSRRHAIILARKKFLTIRDLHSRNGTYINDLRLMPEQDVPLEHGDYISFGNLQMQIIFSVLPPNKLASPDDATAPPPKITQYPGAGRHVMIFEADTDVAGVYQLVLAEAGYRVSVVNDADAAEKRLTTDTPQAVIMNIINPEETARSSSGLDTLRLLHTVANRSTTQTPFLVISGIQDERYQHMVIGAGASAFIAKPVRVDELLTRLGELLNTATNP